jgi:putative nucleotidyltransferase-like protein
MPAQIADALGEEAGAIAATNLRSAIECRGLLEDFDRSAMPILFLKGLTLGAIVYQNASIKTAIDIDVLVAEDRAGDAARLLERRGYELRYPHPPATEERLRAWHGERKESVWRKPGERAHIDLHTRLSDNRALIPSLDVDSPRQCIEVLEGLSLPTLRREDLFAYLCVHGASSAWFRLKWITDFAGFLHGCGTGELDHLYRHSQELGAGRSVAQALLLADALFKSLHGNPALRERLNADSVSRWLCRSALRQLMGRAAPYEPTGRPLGTATIHLTQFALLPGVRFKLAELVRQLRTAL